MPAKPIAHGQAAEDQAARTEQPAPRELLHPSFDQRLELLAAEIVADATRAPAEVVERFDTQQQGE